LLLNLVNWILGTRTSSTAAITDLFLVLSPTTRTNRDVVMELQYPDGTVVAKATTNSNDVYTFRDLEARVTTTYSWSRRTHLAIPKMLECRQQDPCHAEAWRDRYW
jgi:hypothetical protein